MVASSFTVTNSVTLIVLLSSSARSKSKASCSLRTSRLDFLCFDPLDFPLPVSLSRVSAIFFWISSAVGSALTTFGFLPRAGPLLPPFWPQRPLRTSISGDVG